MERACTFGRLSRNSLEVRQNSTAFLRLAPVAGEESQHLPLRQTQFPRKVGPTKFDRHSHWTLNIVSFLGDIFNVRRWQVLLAERQARTGRTDIAERTYRKLLARQPDDRSALDRLGRLLLRERRFEEAVEIWRRAAELAPQKSETAFQLARALHRSRRFEAAASEYLRVLTLDPLHEKALQALEQLSERLARSGRAGVVAMEQTTALAREMLAHAPTSSRTHGNALALLASLRSATDPDAAVEDWKQLSKLRPEAIEPLLQIARIRKRQGSSEAHRFFHAVLERDPDHVEALAGFGQTFPEADQAAAIRHLTEWAQRRPRDAAPHVELASLYKKSKAWEQAEAAYREILKRTPNDGRALLHLAQVLSRDPGRRELALDLWRRIADRDPKLPLPLVQRAYLLERAHRTGEAEFEYRAALERSPREMTALVGLARLLARQERWSEAAPLFETAHQVSSERTDVLLGLGRSLERLGRTDDALAAYEKILALDAADANALLYRGRLLRQLGRTGEAIEAWRNVCARSPKNADAWHELVFMLATAERDAEALGALDAAEAALPALPASWTRLGLAAQAGQFHDRAVKHFERAIAAEPHEASHHARLGQHYFRQGIVDGAFHHLLASRELRPTDLEVTKQLVDTVHTLFALGIDPPTLHKAAPRYGEILTPERLFTLVRTIADTEIAPYDPVPGRIIAVSASLAGGGAERQLVNLLRGLGHPAQGLDLALFCISLASRTRRDFFLPLLRDVPVEIVTAENRTLEEYLIQPAAARYARLIRSFPADMAGPIAFWLTEFRRRRPQIVHAWQDSTCLTAAVAALLSGVPRIVLAARSVRPDNPRRRLKRFMREGYQSLVGHASVVLTNNSRAGANDYAEWLGIDPDTIEVVYNGIDCDQPVQDAASARARLRTRLGVPASTPIVGSAFRMSEEKQPLLWIEVAATVARAQPEAHFVVFGDGPMRVDMIDLARRLGIADRFHLPGPEDDVISCYAAMDVVMISSRHEGLPNVLLEAQSVGTPVVAPAVGGIVEAVQRGVTGWTVEQSDAAALADRVLACLVNKEWAEKARVEGPRFVRQRFSITAMVNRTLEVYGLKRLPGQPPLAPENSDELMFLDEFLFEIMLRMLRSDGVDASGLYAFYQARIEQGLGALTAYDRMLFDYVLANFDRKSRRFVHAGIGIGTLTSALAVAGCAISGIESDAPRYRAASRVRAALLDLWPATAQRYELLGGEFPTIVDGTSLASPETVLIFTNCGAGWPEELTARIIAALPAFGDVILDARLFGNVRDSPEERQALMERIEAAGMVATPIAQTPPMTFYYHLRPQQRVQ